jgi:acetolactate synthase-1/2/3 large subunit
MQTTVARLLVQYLQRLGIDTVFGMPGAHVLPIYDAFHDAALTTILVKHEQGAAFMAGGYARVAQRPAACIATAGPGATNLVTGIANAHAERLPVLALTGETSTYIFGRGGLQESAGEGGAIDQCLMFSGITRYRRLVERTDYLGQVLNQATRALLGPDPGPVLLSIPYNVQKEAVDDAILEDLSAPRPRPEARPSPELLALVDLIASAERPVIVAGHGCIRADAREEVAQLAGRLAIPVATSLKAKGVIAEGGPLSLGSLGVTSSGHAYRYITESADALIFLGAGFNERTSYLWDARLVRGKKLAQVDSDAAQLGRVFRPDVAIHGDIRAVLRTLLAHLDTHPIAPRQAPQAAGEAFAPPAGDGGERFALIAAFFDRLARHFPHGMQLFDDNIVFAQNYLAVGSGNHYYPNTGISSLGHAIPAALGGRLAAPQRPTFALLGDGGFQMCGMELMTAVNHGIPINAVVINNATLSLIRKNQLQHYGGRYIDCDFVNPDFALLARAFGIEHHRVADIDDLDRLFETADLDGAINLVEIILDKHAFPSYVSAR